MNFHLIVLQGSEKMKTENQHDPSRAFDAQQDIPARFTQLLEGQGVICDELEFIADGLPNSIDVQSCLRTAQKLLTVVKTAHDFEEAVLFPLLGNRNKKSAELTATVERLRYEHWGDEEYALDVHHALREFVRQREKANVDSLAWMLRGFFEGMRRHLAFDREYLLPMLKEVATVRSKNAY
jgi:hypothetical protein